VILMAGQALNETNQRVPGEYAHTRILPCSQNGHNEILKNQWGVPRNPVAVSMVFDRIAWRRPAHGR
jgi:hypothetical protein